MAKKKRKVVPIPITEPTEDELQAFNMRSDYIAGKIPGYKKPRYTEIDIKKFFYVMFRRPGDGRWPFEGEQCREWQQWKAKHNEWKNGLREWREAGGTDEEYIEHNKISYSDVAKHVYNPIILNFVPITDDNGEIKYNEEGDILSHPERYIVTTSADDENTLMTEWVEKTQGSYFCITGPVLYRGWNRGLKNAQRCFGIGIDLDFVTKKEYMVTILGLMVVPFEGKIQFPVANIITNSGHGLHLYFLFKDPIDIHTEDQQIVMKKLKKGLINRLWSTNVLKYQTTEKTKREDIQYQGITQGFRVPGSKTKFLSDVCSFACNQQHYFTVKELNEFVPSSDKLTKEEVLMLETGKPYDPNKTKLEVAKVKWPTWYEEIVVKKRPKKIWHTKRYLYDFLLKLFRTDGVPISVGHRYHVLRSLTAAAVKCNVPYEELEKDVMSFVPWFKSLGTTEKEKFRDTDVTAALESYYDPEVRKFKWDYILENCGVGDFYGSRFRKISPEEEAKKVHRDQKSHLARARAVQNVDDPEGTWRGRPVATVENSKEAAMIFGWRNENPDSNNKSKCAKELGLSRTTVTKWWDRVLLEWTETDELQTLEDMPEVDFMKMLSDAEGMVDEDITYLLNAGVGVFKDEEMTIPDIE